MDQHTDNKVSSEILGQILLLQSTLHVIPYGTKMGEFICRGIHKIPGISAVKLNLDNEFVSIYPESYQANADPVISLPLKTTMHKYGELIIHQDKPDLFELYRPHIENTVNLISLVLENRRQELELLKLNTTLEMRVREQTQTLRDNAQRLKAHAQHTPLGVIEWDLDFKVTEWNSAAEKIFGFTREEVIGQSGKVLVPHEFHDQLDEIWRALASKTGGTLSTNENITKNGKLVICDWYNTTLVDNEGNIIGVASLVQDITDRKKQEEELRHLATYDSLTDLPNRSLFDELFKHAIASSNRTHQKHAVLFLDLDNFKNINDSLGHTKGDILLKDVAKRLENCMRKEDCVARFGGDEFVILLNDIRNNTNVAEIADKIITVLSSPFELDEKDIVISTSIGIVIYPDDGDTSQELLRKADTAMYQAKKSRSNHYQFFTNDMNLRVIERMDIERKIRHGLTVNEFIPYFQPKVEVPTGNIIGIEALARWRRKDKSIINPGAFIPVAEESGLIVPLDQYIIKTTLNQAKSWLEEGLSIPSIAVNLSTLQFRHKELILFVDGLLERYSFSDNFLEFEITEGTLMEDSSNAIELMQQLHDRGISLTIDDFGTGYSSLSYLKHFPVKTLKIDLSFIRDMTKSKKDRKMVASIIALAHNLDIQVVAEGVETEEQLNILKDFGCNIVQGFLFSKPVSAESMKVLIEDHNKLNFK